MALYNHMLSGPPSQASKNAFLGAPFLQLGISETTGSPECQAGYEGRQAFRRRLLRREDSSSGPMSGQHGNPLRLPILVSCFFYFLSDVDQGMAHGALEYGSPRRVPWRGASPRQCPGLWPCPLPYQCSCGEPNEQCSSQRSVPTLPQINSPFSSPFLLPLL